MLIDPNYNRGMSMNYFVDATEKAFAEYEEIIKSFKYYKPESSSEEDVESVINNVVEDIVEYKSNTVDLNDSLMVYFVGHPTPEMTKALFKLDEIIKGVNSVYEITNDKKIVTDIYEDTDEDNRHQYFAYATSTPVLLEGIPLVPSEIGNNKVGILSFNEELFRHTYVSSGRQEHNRYFYLPVRIAYEDVGYYYGANKAYGSYNNVSASITITESPVEDLDYHYSNQFSGNFKYKNNSSKDIKTISLVIVDLQELTFNKLNLEGDRAKDFEYLYNSRIHTIPTRLERKMPYLIKIIVSIDEALYKMKTSIRDTSKENKPFNFAIFKSDMADNTSKFWNRGLFDTVQNYKAIGGNLSRKGAIEIYDKFIFHSTHTAKLLDVRDIYVTESFIGGDHTTNDIQRYILTELYKKATGDIYIINKM